MVALNDSVLARAQTGRNLIVLKRPHLRDHLLTLNKSDLVEVLSDYALATSAWQRHETDDNALGLVRHYRDLCDELEIEIEQLCTGSPE